MTTRPTATHRISDTALCMAGKPSIFRGCLATIVPCRLGAGDKDHLVVVHIDLDEVVRRDLATAEERGNRWPCRSAEDVEEEYGTHEEYGLPYYNAFADDLVPLDGADEGDETPSADTDDTFDALFAIVDRSFSTRALAHALGSEPCPLGLSCILDRLTLAELSELVENRHDPSFVLSYGAAS